MARNSTIIKKLFKHRKTRYRGVIKIGHPPQMFFGLTTLAIAARKVTA